VRVQDGRFICVLCGAELGVSERETVTTIAGASGKPNERILSVNGKVVHRCALRRHQGRLKP